MLCFGIAKNSKKFFNTDGFHAVHIHLNIIVLSPLTWNIITSKDIFWGLCYHNHVRKPSIYSQQRSSFKRSKRRGQAWANSSAWGEGLLFMFPVGEITSPVGECGLSQKDRVTDEKPAARVSVLTASNSLSPLLHHFPLTSSPLTRRNFVFPWTLLSSLLLWEDIQRKPWMAVNAVFQQD